MSNYRYRMTSDLDVDTPEDVSPALRSAVEKYNQSMIDLQSSWGDDNAGKVWGKIANVLERAAKSIDKIIDKGY